VNKHRRNLLAIHCATLLFGLAGVIAKASSLPAIIVTFGRVAFSSLFLFAVIKLTKQKLRLPRRKDYALMFIGGVIMALHWSAFIQSIQVSTVAMGAITFSTFPLFVSFLEPLMFRDKIRPASIGLAAAMLIGVAIMAVPGGSGTGMTQGIVYGMAGSVSYAILSLLNRKLGEKHSGTIICFYEQSAAAIVLLPALLFIRVSITAFDLGLLIIMGVVCTAIAYTLFVSGLKRVKVQTAGIISGMESVYGIALAMLFLREFPGPREIIGGLIVITAAILGTVKSRNSVIKISGGAHRASRTPPPAPPGRS